MLLVQGRTRFLQKRECCAGALEGRFIATLAKLNNAKTVLEVGMFTGTTTLAVAQALPDDGMVRDFFTLFGLTTWPVSGALLQDDNYLCRQPHDATIHILCGRHRRHTCCQLLMWTFSKGIVACGELSWFSACHCARKFGEQHIPYLRPCSTASRQCCMTYARAWLTCGS